MIPETKIAEKFPESQFIIEKFSEPYRLDRTVNGGVILLYVKEDIPIKCFKWITVSNSLEGLFIEVNWINKKWILGYLYNAHRDKIIYHLNSIKQCI